MEKLRWGILGCAAIAERAVIPAIHESEYNEVSAVASRDGEKAKQYAQKNNIPRHFDSYEALLNDETIEAVYIPLPNHLHKEWTIKAMEAGKHVLCEKPITLNANEAAEIAKVSQETGKLVIEAFMYRYQTRFEIARSLIAQGAIGDIRLFKGAFTFNSSSNTKDVRYVKEWGGGSLYDVGCYPISAARLLLQAEPIAVCMQGKFVDTYGGVDMFASGLIEFPNDVGALIDCGMWAAFRNEIEVIGTEAVLKIPHAFVPQNDDQTAIFIEKDGQTTRYDATYINSYVLQADLFAKAIRLGDALPYRIEDAVLNMKVIDAAMQSMETKQRVELS